MWWVVGEAGIRLGNIAFTTFGATFAIVGWAVWKLKNWSRIAVIAIVLLDFLTTHVGSYLIGLHAPSLIRAFVGLVLFFYLDSPDIKAAFQVKET